MDSEEEFDKALESIFKYGSEDKIFLTSICGDCWGLEKDSHLRKTLRSISPTCSRCGCKVQILDNIKNG